MAIPNCRRWFVAQPATTRQVCFSRRLRVSDVLSRRLRVAEARGRRPEAEAGGGLSLAARLGYLEPEPHRELSSLCIETGKVLADLIRALRE